MTTHLYRVCYHCPACPDDHCLDKVIRSPDALDGHPLLDAYHGDETRPEVVAILGEPIKCPTAQKIVTPELEQFFLEQAR